MNKTFLKIMSFILVILTLLPLTLACKKKEEGGDEEETAVTTAPEVETYRDDLPELDFKGEAITFVSRDSDVKRNEVTVAADDTSDIVNEAVYDREKTVEKRLNVDIINVLLPETEVEDHYIVMNAVQNDILTNSGEYDIGVSNASQFYEKVGENLSYNLYEVPYLNTGKDYYSQLQIEKSVVDGALYAVTGDASMTLIKKSLVTYFNKKLVEQLKVPDLYETVKKGDWTFAYQKELAMLLYESADDVADETDVYGFVTDAREGVDAYLSGWEIRLVERDVDGRFVVNVDVAKMSSALKIINEAFYQTKGIFATNFRKHKDWHPYEKKEEMFGNDQAMFATLELGACERTYLRNMESEYGIIPIPKYDDKQEGYYTQVEDLYSLYFILSSVSAERLDAVGATLECFFSESDQVRYNLFEVALKVKYQSDSLTGQMLDIIIDNVKIDSGWVYTGHTKGLAQMFRDLVEKESSDLTSEYNRKKMTATLGFNKMYEKLDALAAA
ncbi:MAG: hypothetical protein IJV72_07345 [Clostridia bacterium]|nr:hypothetical protein [Clostridia bacterium]